ncbi:hypothetical protein [Maliponia aquimaris]|uniref:AAA+ family ATPase n=1 Tax=Maliponia aquimaris TaxID=1673631 RepID=A0A238L2Z0_9RHOB|nr:hypothetical protein [Maliponia aquimaris]SMX49465.1 hypothetical protein MAA8898_04304 [Maliponia aquimaris]
MKHLAAPLFALSLIAAPLAAQDDDDGLNLMEEGARLFLRGLMTEMEPALRELDEAAREMEPLLRDFALEMGPALSDLLGQVEDWTLYHPPEMLENGDIILRRRVPLEPEMPEPDPEADALPDTDEKIDL